MAMAAAAAAVIRPEPAEGGQNHENRLFIKKHNLMTILVISGPSIDLKNGSGLKFCIG